MTVKKAVKLSKIEAGVTVIFNDFTAGHELRTRLATMGMVPGTDMKVVSNMRRGPVVINIKGSKIALGRGMADKIMVEIK